MFVKREDGLLVLPDTEMQKLQAKEEYIKIKKAKKKGTTVAELAERLELLEKMHGIE